MAAGRVYLIGAGPGSADLISLRGLRALRAADAVLIDRLLPRNILHELEVSPTGKQIVWLDDMHPHWSQCEINAWLAQKSRQGLKTAQLKGGDPFIFGQAEEETAHLAKLGIPWEAIPAPSSFTAALTEAGFPLTRRNQGRSFAVATARTIGGEIPERFPRADSLVIMMGAGVLKQTAARLIADGWPADTPAAVIERGTMAWERCLLSSLRNLAADAARADISSPACVIVGDAAAPLFAVRQRPTILFTGLDPGNFRTLGNLIHWPALELVGNGESQQAIPEILSSCKNRGFDWIVFCEKTGVASFYEHLDKRQLDSRILAGMRIAACGAGTAARLREHGIRPDAGGDDCTTDELLHWLGAVDGKSILLLAGTHCPRSLYDGLLDRGAEVRDLTFNCIVANRLLGRPLPAHDVIFFVSPSGVRAYYDAYGAAAFRKQAWCLGEETRRELSNCGADVYIPTASEYAIDAAVPV